MKLLTVGVLALVLSPDRAVRFEADGVRIDGVLVTGRVVELRGGVLASGTSLEPLAAAVEVDVAPGRVLRLEPGVRATREGSAVRLSSMAGRPLALETDGREISAGAVVEAAADGWRVDGVKVDGAMLRAKLQNKPPSTQDDADSSLQKMRQSSQRMRDASAKMAGKRRVFRGGDPVVSSQAADSVAIRQLAQLSPIGQ